MSVHEEQRHPKDPRWRKLRKAPRERGAPRHQLGRLGVRIGQERSKKSGGGIGRTRDLELLKR
jgi:hypothetical protein